jgi:acyl carrier protein
VSFLPGLTLFAPQVSLLSLNLSAIGRTRAFNFAFTRNPAMDRTELRQTLLTILEDETWEKFGDLQENADLRKGLNLDSIDLASVVLEIQHRLDVEISSDELEKIVVVGDLLDLLQSKLGAPPQSRAA